MIDPIKTRHSPVIQLLTGHYHETSGYRAFRRDGVGDWLLIYTEGGSGRFGYPGGELITASGDWVLIRPGTLHDYGTTGDRWDLVWAHFHPRPEWRPWLDWPSVHGGLMHLRLGDAEAAPVAARFIEVHRLMSSDHRRRDAFAMNALEAVLLDCDRLNPLAAEAGLDPRIRAAMDYLDRHLAEKTNIDDVAAAVGLSASRLAHLFKSVTGQTPQRYLESRRMQRATDLLGRTGFPIKQIAAAVGFDSPFYFSQRFKAWAGKSPTEHRSEGSPASVVAARLAP